LGTNFVFIKTNKLGGFFFVFLDFLKLKIRLILLFWGEGGGGEFAKFLLEKKDLPTVLCVCVCFFPSHFCHVAEVKIVHELINKI
jgi:hypothetical protein